MLKKKEFLLITILSIVNLFSITLFAESPYDDYFPLQVGNVSIFDWKIVNIGEFYLERVIGTIRISDTNYFISKKGSTTNNVYKNDTLRLDEMGRVWKYENNVEQIWFDFSSDTVYQYIYELNNNLIDTFEVHVERNCSKKIGLYKCDSCISIWFDNPNLVDEEIEYTFVKGIGLGHIQYEGGATPNVELSSSTFSNRVIDMKTDFFPLKVGNKWEFTTEYCESYLYQITDSLYFDNQLHYIFQGDTIRKDYFGRIWRFEDGFEQIWLDFSAPVDSHWVYIESNFGEKLNYVYSIDRNISSKTYFGNKDSCVFIYCNTEDVTDLEEEKIYVPGFGIHRINRWNYSAYVYKAQVNNHVYSDCIEYFNYSGVDDTTFIVGQCSYPYMYLQLIENYIGIDSVLIYDSQSDNLTSFVAGFVIDDYLNIKSYEIWYEPIVSEYYLSDTTTHIVKFDSLYECLGKFKLNLKIYHGLNLLDTTYQIYRGYESLAVDDPEEIETFHLSQNYPNPFNPTTNISYILPRKSEVKISVFDLSGRLVETLVNEQKSAGYYQVNWNAERYASGVYFYRIEAGEFMDFRKCLLVK